MDEGHQRSELITLIDNYADIMSTFRDDRIAWESTYATAFCKLSNFGTTYAPGKVSFLSFLLLSFEGWSLEARGFNTYTYRPSGSY